MIAAAGAGVGQPAHNLALSPFRQQRLNRQLCRPIGLSNFLSPRATRLSNVSVSDWYTGE